MNVPSTIGAIAAMIFTVGSMLTMWVFSAASLANAKPDAIHRVKLWVISFSLLSLIGIGAGIWLLVQKRYGWSAGVSLLPSLVMFLVLIWKLIQ